MRPLLTTNDSRNVTSGYFKLSCYRDLSNSIFYLAPQALHLLICQFVEWMIFPSAQPVFGRRILGIFFVGSNKQMVWINAITNIAFVAYKKPFRNGAKRLLPRQTVNKKSCSINAHQPISRPSRGALPQPAGFRFADKELHSRANRSALGANLCFELSEMDRSAIDFSTASVTFGKHLKTFLSGVKGAIGYSRWLPTFSPMAALIARI